jgi:hypothetical protein
VLDELLDVSLSSPSEGQVLKFNGTLWTNAADESGGGGGGGGGIPESAFNAKGDLLAGTAPDSYSVLPVGTDGLILVADSSEPTGLRWDTLSAVTSQHGELLQSVDYRPYGVPSGALPPLVVPYNCTIDEVRLAADQNGNVIVDVWRSTDPMVLPTAAGSICGTNKPFLNNARMYRDTALSGWTTTTLTEGDWIIFNLSSASILKSLTVVLVITRTS